MNLRSQKGYIQTKTKTQTLLQPSPQCRFFPSLALGHTDGSKVCPKGHSSHVYSFYIPQFFLKNIPVNKFTGIKLGVSFLLPKYQNLGVYVHFSMWKKTEALLPSLFCPPKVLKTPVNQTKSCKSMLIVYWFKV